jgi:succinyl-CoA synthetase beta subunit
VNLHEYQARNLLKAAGIAVPDAEIAETAEQVEAIARRMAGPVVIKAQVHAGGRGKAGGVKLAKDPKGARDKAEQILGMQIKGLTVGKVLVAPAADIASESYLGIIVDRASQRPVIMVSPAGGVDIEEVAAKTPEKIFRLAIDPRFGLLSHQAMALGFKLYRDVDQVRQAATIMQRLYQAFVNAGASLAEINPLITVAASPGRKPGDPGAVLALDAKIVVDDNELERRPEIAALRDSTAEEPSEIKAREAGLSFIKLDGNVGCCVNGAGLAMATMDLVKFYGGEPANFLDIGGSSNPQKVVDALGIITSDPKVKSILFNIFGGITRCDDVANGIVAATQKLKLGRPLVIRLTGTNEELATEILEKNGFTAGTDMDDAVKQAVKLAKDAA